ncbi:MAG: hypothetical protein IT314_08015 [Anaerolineales bacterium]|nr:hypothetical protein [Anaerolineales bacterium]
MKSGINYKTMNENRPGDSPRSETAKLARNQSISLSLLVAILTIGIALWMNSRLETRDPEIVNWKLAFLVNVLIAIGTSIFASVAFYWFYSRYAEERVLRSVSEQVSRESVDYAEKRYSQRFEKLLPRTTYDATSKSTEGFNDDFNELFSSSNTYFFKGDAGSYASYRLTELCENKSLLDKHIRLLVLDPRDDRVLLSRVNTEYSRRNLTKQQLAKATEDLREKIFVTLVALFDICHKARVEVALYKEYPFFRTEIFDEGLFLTYYISGDTSTSYLYSRKTLAYDAYMLNFIQNFDGSNDHIVFGNETNERDLQAILGGYGCKIQLAELRKSKEKRFAQHQQGAI